MKISRNRMIYNRVRRLKRRVKLDTQKIRGDTIEKLEKLFKLASSLARGKFETQTANGEKVKVTMKQRQMWARVAAYIAQVMNNIAERFDERQVDAQLNELERLVHEARTKTETKKAES